MGRRSSGNIGLVVLGAVVFVPIALFQQAQKYPMIALILCVIVVTGMITLIVMRKSKLRRLATDVLLTCDELTKKHISTLSIKRRQTVIEGAYGEIQITSYDKEIEYFINNILYGHIHIQLTALGDANLVGPSRVILMDRIKNLVESHYADNEDRYSDDIPDDPIEFERWCMEKLNAVGWNARTTQGSGDQGADVIAKKGNELLIVQCKLHGKQVGNKAVQEVSAARIHYGGTRAAVVCVNGFTKSARQLAATNNVILLDAAEINLIEDYF